MEAIGNGYEMERTATKGGIEFRAYRGGKQIGGVVRAKYEDACELERCYGMEPIISLWIPN